MTAILLPEDFAHSLPGVSTERLQDIIDDAWAIAVSKVPCIASAETLADENKVALIKAIIRRAINYDVSTSQQNIAGESAGPYRVDYQRRTTSPTLYTEDQIGQLRAICAGDEVPDEFTAGVYSMPVSSSMPGPRSHGYLYGERERQYFSRPFWR